MGKIPLIRNFLLIFTTIHVSYSYHDTCIINKTMENERREMRISFRTAYDFMQELIMTSMFLGTYVSQNTTLNAPIERRIGAREMVGR